MNIDINQNGTSLQKDLVSIVIPTFNRAYCLPETIDSVLRQSHHNIEVIIADDGSTDDTEQMIRKRYSGDQRVHYYHQANKGVCAARNLGIDKSNGDYVAFLDSDDVWKPWKLDLQLACLQRFPGAGMVWTDMEAVDAGGNIIASRYLRRMYSAYRWFTPDELFAVSCPLPLVSGGLPTAPSDSRLYYGDIFSQMVMGNLVQTSTVLIRRERLEQVRGFNEELLYSGEDYDFHLRTCRVGPVAFADVATIRYRVGAKDQLTQPCFSIHVARNWLSTILPVIANERDRINLPTSMIHRVLAEVYGWMGELQLSSGETREAAANLFRSLRFHFWQPRLAALAVISLLPPTAGRSFLKFIRMIKDRMAA